MGLDVEQDGKILSSNPVYPGGLQGMTELTIWWAGGLQTREVVSDRLAARLQGQDAPSDRDYKPGDVVRLDRGASDLGVQRSVLQDWVMTLTTRQQGVLILALRGPDGSVKESAAKPIVRTLRAVVMVSGRERKPMDFDTMWRDDTFMSTVYVSQDGAWEAVMAAFFAEMDAFNLHFFQHLIHAFAVAGCACPHDAVRRRCWQLYERACHKLHLHVEQPGEIMHRLRDGIREEDSRG